MYVNNGGENSTPAFFISCAPNLQGELPKRKIGEVPVCFLRIEQYGQLDDKPKNSSFIGKF